MATVAKPTRTTVPLNSRAPDYSRPINPSLGRSNVQLGFSACDAFVNSGKLRFKVDSEEGRVDNKEGKVRVWCSFGDLLAYKDGMQSFNEFIRSEKFLEAGGSSEQQDRCRLAWKSFLLGNPTGGIPYTATKLLPNHLKRQPRKVVAAQLLEEEWKVCLEVKAAVEVGPKQWRKDESLLEACAAYCEKVVDWTDLYTL